MVAVVVRSRDEAASYVSKGAGAVRVRALISITGPAQEPPDFAQKLAADRVPVLHLEFSDTEDPEAPGAFSNEHFEELLEFITDEVPGIATSDGEKILVHCRAGVSRSSAVALVVWTTLVDGDLSVGTSNKIMKALLTDRPTAFPNILITRVADAALECDGRLEKLAHAIRLQSQWPGRDRALANAAL